MPTNLVCLRRTRSLPVLLAEKSGDPSLINSLRPFVRLRSFYAAKAGFVDSTHLTRESPLSNTWTVTDAAFIGRRLSHQTTSEIIALDVRWHLIPPGIPRTLTLSGSVHRSVSLVMMIFGLKISLVGSSIVTHAHLFRFNSMGLFVDVSLFTTSAAPSTNLPLDLSSQQGSRVRIHANQR